MSQPTETSYVVRHDLQVADRLADFIEVEALAGLDFDADRFWGCRDWSTNSVPATVTCWRRAKSFSA